MPVIMVTARGSEQIAIEGMKAGLSDYLTPANLERLPQAIQELGRKPAWPSRAGALFQAIGDATDEWEAVVSVDGHYWSVSSAFEHITGYSRDEYLADPHRIETSIVHPEDRTRFLSHQSQEADDPEHRSDIEFRILHRDGTERWINRICLPVFASGGRLWGWRIRNRDITAQKKLADTLHQREQTLLAMLETPVDGGAIIDKDGVILAANVTLVRRLGYTEDGLIGKKFTDVQPPDLALERWGKLMQVFETGQALRFVDHRAGIWYDHSIYPIFTAQGEIAQVATLSRDISEYKQAELELQQSYRTIQALISGPTDIAMLIDTQATVLMANETLAQIFGKTSQEMVGLKVLEVMPPHVAAQRKQAFDEVMRTGRPVRFQDEGMTGTFDHLVYPILDSQGQVTQIAVLARDISDLNRATDIARQNEAILRAVVNTASLAVLAVNSQGEITLAEGRALPLLGYRTNEILGKNIFDATLSPNKALEYLGRALAGQDMSGIEFYSGENKFIMHYHTLYDGQGQVAGATGIAIDITAIHRVQEKLRQSRDQLEFILQGVADGITVIDANGKLIYANEAAAQRLGFRSLAAYLNSPGTARQMEIRNEAGQIIPVDQHPGRRILSGRPHPPIMVQYQRLGETDWRWAVVNDQAVRDERSKIQMVVTITHDITEIKRLQQTLETRVAERTAELAQANQLLRSQIARAETLLRLASRLNASLDLQAVLQTICEEAIQLIDYPIASVHLYDEPSDTLRLAAAAGKDLELQYRLQPIPRVIYESYVQAFGEMIVIPDLVEFSEAHDYDLMMEARVRTLISITLFQEGEVVAALGVASQDEVHAPNEDEKRLLQGLADQASIAIANARLFAQVSDSQKRLQALSQQLVKSQEEERRRLGRELHDDVGQMLTALNLNLDRIEQNSWQSTSPGTGPHDEVLRARRTIDQLLDRVRQISIDLRPPMLDDLGLLPALLTLFERYSETMHIAVQFHHSGVKQRYPAAVETAAFRIIQEALTNATRHARVEKASVRLWATDEMLGVQVEDRGAGFNLAAAQAKHISGGLSNMRERAELCGGRLEIEAVPGGGTCITAEFPLASESPEHWPG